MVTDKLSNKQQKIVRGEIQEWIQERLIDESLGASLLSRYPASENKTNVSEILTMIGSVLVGLGTILFIAANWSAITVGIKLIIIVLAIIISHALGWKFYFEPGKHPRLGASILVLASLFFGAGIWLIAQVFNIDRNFSDGVLLWAIGTIGVTMVTNLVPLGCLSAILLNWWCFSSGYMTYGRTDDGAGIIPTFLVASIASILIAAKLRSRAVMWIALLMGTWVMLFQSFGVSTPLLLWGLALFAGQLWCSHRNQLFTNPFLYVGNVCILGALLISTFGHARTDNFSILQAGILLVATLIALITVAWKVPKFRIEMAICVVVAIAVPLTYGYQEGAHRMAFNIFLLMAIGGLAYSGLNRLQSMAVVNIALIFFVFDVIARYFDLFYTTMNRSLFFVGGGIILMIAGAFAERSRRKLEQTFLANDESTDSPPVVEE